MLYKNWIFISEQTRTFFMTTHVNFEGMSDGDIKLDILTWKRSPGLKGKLNSLAEAKDFHVELDTVSSVNELRHTKERYVRRGYHCLNSKITLQKQNKHLK